ncbi:MAG: ABC transporter permease [Actinomycetota bacterium]
MSFRRISGVYVLAVLLMIFALWIPDLFFTETNIRTMLNQQALTAIVSLGLMMAMAAGAFDLSIGTTVGISAVVAASLLGLHGYPAWIAIAIALVAALLVGIANAIAIIHFRLSSFIATLAMSSILIAATTWVTNGDNITGMPHDFQQLATTQLLGLQLPVWFALMLGVILWYILEQTPLGRFLYATGANPDAARLAGVPTGRLIVFGVVTCSLIAGLCGVLATATLGAGSPSVGPPYLLPAFSAVFLGSTQFRPGRVNVTGTLLAVLVLATGVKGLQLAGAPFWIPDLFNGVALLIAVGLSIEGRQRFLRRRRRSDFRAPGQRKTLNVST